MTTVSPDTTTAEKFTLSKSFRRRGSYVYRTLAVAQLSIVPQLWSGFVAGAYRSYRKRGGGRSSQASGQTKGRVKQ